MCFVGVERPTLVATRCQLRNMNENDYVSASANANANANVSAGEYCEYYSHSQLLSAVKVEDEGEAGQMTL